MGRIMTTRLGLKILSIVALIAFSATIGVVFGELNLSNAFLYFRIARVIDSGDSGTISSFEAEGIPSDPTYFGYEALLIAISQVGGLDPETLIGFPLGSILLPIVFFAVARRLVREFSIAVLLTVYIVSFYALLSVQYDTFVYAFAHISFLSVILILAMPRVRRSGQGVVLLTLLFVGSYVVYHTTPVWIITLMLVLSIPILRRLRGLPRRAEGLSLSVAFLVLYLAFNETVYRTFVPLVAGFGTWSVEGFFASGSHASAALGAGSLLPWVNLAIHLMIVIPLAIWLVVKVKSFRNSGRTRSVLDRLIIAGIIVALSQFFIHGIFGSLSNRLVLLILPIMALAVLVGEKGRNVEKSASRPGGWSSLILTHRKAIALAMGGSFASLSLFGFAIFYFENAPGIDPTTRNLSAQWLIGAADNEPRLTSDLDTFAMFELRYAKNGRIAHLVPYDEPLYDWLIGRPANPERLPDFLLVDVDRAPQTILGINWERFPGPAESLPLMENNRGLNLVYNNGSVLIFSFNRGL